MFFAKIPSHTRQNAITEGDLECILTRNCEGTEQLQCMIKNETGRRCESDHGAGLFVLYIDDTLSHFICLFCHVSDGLYLT